jgi:mono/diheme cytochrome c family protein
MNPLMNNSVRRNALILIFLLLSVPVLAYAEQLASSPPQTRERIDAGKLYHKYCAPCHGDHGDGNSRAQTALDPPPRNFTTAKSREELSPERMITSVTYGRPGTAMVGWKRRLSEDQIAAVVAYVRKTFMESHDDSAPAAPTTAGDGGDGGYGDAGAMPANPHKMSMPVNSEAQAKPVDMTLPFPDGLKGDPRKGRDFFLHNCFTCHGKKGDGRGPRYKSIQPRPRNFLSADSRSRFNRPALFHSISKGKVGSVMPAWEKVLTPQQIADVGEFVFEAFIQGKGVDLSGRTTATADVPADKKKADSDDGY